MTLALPITPKPLKSNEWYTPAKYIEAARATMGSIDLDPASSVLANQTVQATRYITKDEDGLAQPWKARNVWLNPPYSFEDLPRGMVSRGKSAIFPWIQRLIDAYHVGDIEQAILCTKADPKQRWFTPLWEFPICFTHGKVLFNRPDTSPEGHMFGTAFVYLGPHEERFVEQFCAFGAVARRIA